MVHNKPVVLRSLLISPVPLFNRARTGCRPFVEIHAGGTKLWSTYENYDDLKVFEIPDAQFAEIALGNVPAGDDVQVRY
ncbi:unnamed protein product [Gongylonema pulchrum]|uniref:C2 tensin-type domain-containing protein n=1 Tax=Gongylonema pulchrum TaxID=637853 RepID=A0A183EYP3_9BILA|nr:unnamed protein product [Gongylonema pulchrum]